MSIAYWIVFATIYLPFYFLIIHILRILKFVQCLYAFFVRTGIIWWYSIILFLKFSNSRCSYCVLIFHETFLTTKGEKIFWRKKFSETFTSFARATGTIVLLMLDAIFGGWLWFELNSCNMYLSGHFLKTNFVTKEI